MSTFQYQTKLSPRVSKAEVAIQSLLSEKLNSQQNDRHQTRVYKQFGHGMYSYELARDLLDFRDATKAKKSQESFVAVFEKCDDLSAAEFEKCLWKELSSIASHPEFSAEDSAAFGRDTDEDKFFFTLDGSVFAVQAMHPHHADTGKRFPYATLLVEVAPPEKLVSMGNLAEITKENSDKSAGALFLNGFANEGFGITPSLSLEFDSSAGHF
jgi:hypothetical protein